MSHRTLAGLFLMLGAVVAPGGSGAAPSPVIPPPITRTLDNGLRVAVFPIHRLPILQIELVVPAGQSAEPADQPGVAFLTAQMLTRGTSSRDAATFAADVARLGGTITSASSRDDATLTGAFLARDLAPAMELLSDAALNPVFAEDALGSVRTQATRTLDQLHQNAAAIAEEQVWGALFEGQPYGRPLLGSDSAVAAMTHDHLRAFYRDHYRPDAAVLVIAGDVAPDSAFAAAREAFGRWNGHAVRPAPARMPEPEARVRVRILDVPDAEYSIVRLGFRLPGRRADDEVPLTLAVTELAGGRFSRLQSPRVTRRLGPDVNGTLLSLRDGGVLSFGAPARSDSVAAVIDVLRSELRDFVAHPPTESEMAAIRRGSVGGYLSSLETLGGRITSWSGNALLDRDADAMNATARRLSSVRADEFAAAIRRWLGPDHLVIVAVGPARVLGPELARFGTVEVSRLPEPPAAHRDTASATPEAVARGRELVTEAIRAHGGLDSLRAIHDSVIDEKVASAAQREGFTGSGTLHQTRKEPDRLVSISTYKEYQSRQILNGNRGWTVTGSDVVSTDSLQTLALRTSFESDLPHLLLATEVPGVRLVSTGPDHIEQREVDGVEVRIPGQSRRRYYFEKASHLLAAIDFFTDAGDGTEHRSRRTYGEYQNVGHLRWPFREQREIDGHVFMRIEIQTVRINPGIPDREFDPPRSR
ncbi:MAG TPA: pitrilysin family protein [Candidatus Udaeobacter sp.]|jgi:zinc protease|nr:pitrilysin family protein [Candidatus Udaeobacter sp.]